MGLVNPPYSTVEFRIEILNARLVNKITQINIRVLLSRWRSLYISWASLRVKYPGIMKPKLKVSGPIRERSNRMIPR